MEYLNLLLSALSQGLLYLPMALGVYIAFGVLHTPDLTIDGSLVLGMSVCAVLTIAGYPYLALLAGMLAGALAGAATGLLQTKLRLEPILSGILVMTGLYTVNYLILGGQANLYLQSPVVDAAGRQSFVASNTIYQDLISRGVGAANPDWAVLLLTGLIVALSLVLLDLFFRTRPGLALRATGDNEAMVRCSSINADRCRIGGVMLANAFVALSGSLLCQQQRYADLNNGSGMLVVGLASVIIGQALCGSGGVRRGLLSAGIGSLAYRLILQLAYKVDMPSYGVKLLSVLIVIAALCLPRLQRRLRKAKGGAR